MWGYIVILISILLWNWLISITMETSRLLWKQLLWKQIVHSAFDPSEVGKMSTGMHGLLRSGCACICFQSARGKLIIVKRLWDVCDKGAIQMHYFTLLCISITMETNSSHKQDFLFLK